MFIKKDIPQIKTEEQQKGNTTEKAATALHGTAITAWHVSTMPILQLSLRFYAAQPYSIKRKRNKFKFVYQYCKPSGWRLCENNHTYEGSYLVIKQRSEHNCRPLGMEFLLGENLKELFIRQQLPTQVSSSICRRFIQFLTFPERMRKEDETSTGCGISLTSSGEYFFQYYCVNWVGTIY